MGGQTSDARKRATEQPEEPRYTLDEAAAELRRRSCINHGHDWNILRLHDGTPIRLTCDNCGAAYRVVAFE
jgi:hypothetical protein